MNAEKENLLNKTYRDFLKAVFGQVGPEVLGPITDEQIMGFGTTADEKILSMEQMLALLKRQEEQSAGLNIYWKDKPLKHYYSDDENTAVIADEIFLNIGTGTETVEMYFRSSTVWIYKNNKWLLFHWHASKPENVLSEEDTFGIEDLKKRTLLLEKLVEERTAELKKQKEELEEALSDLKTTQTQLIQSEKMASLGELTAGIAHEIQNPLNFVNNFSDVNRELLTEMKEEIDKGNMEDAKALADDVMDNEEKINHHGKRADSIVKGMLQHSRSSNGIKEPTDINALADEYLRLAYHGLRAKDKSFNATLKTEYDESIGKINIIPQDIGRVILNLITNAFYSVTDKKKTMGDAYEPTVTVSTKRISSPAGENKGVEIKVSDNGNGVPAKVLEKIFQPFFTTKPTGQGTGLGLSMSYDIITKGHNGELKVENKETEGAVFIITLSV